MRRIELTQDKFAIVDNENYEWLSKWKWCAVKHGNTFYAMRKIRMGKKWRTLFMHRVILGLDFGDKRQCDHFNHNGLDNRKAKLRICTRSQNQHNQLPRTNTRSKFKGVVWCKQAKKWIAQIGNNGRHAYLGLFAFEIDAARAYNKAARDMFGEFASLNVA